jgi:hypothetical protein
MAQHPYERASWGSSTFRILEDQPNPFGANDVARKGIFMVVTCTWIAHDAHDASHPHTPSDLAVVDQVFWSDGHGVL